MTEWPRPDEDEYTHPPINAPRTDTSMTFEEWWEKYPTPGGEDYIAAKAAWNARNEAAQTMIDRSDAVNLAREVVERGQHWRMITDVGVKCLADAVLAMDEYIRSHEADQRDAARYRWLASNAELLPYPDQWAGKEWLDQIIDRAVRDGKL